MLGAWQPGHAEGVRGARARPAPRPGSSSTRATTTSPSTFYRDVFEWDTHAVSDTDEFRYTTLGEGENAARRDHGRLAVSGRRPSHWAIYFEVDDTDAALEKVVELGGTRRFERRGGHALRPPRTCGRSDRAPSSGSSRRLDPAVDRRGRSGVRPRAGHHARGRASPRAPSRDPRRGRRRTRSRPRAGRGWRARRTAPSQSMHAS